MYIKVQNIQKSRHFRILFRNNYFSENVETIPRYNRISMILSADEIMFERPDKEGRVTNR